jgi:thiosulfate dehydrogenase [quinone] large subunit
VTRTGPPSAPPIARRSGGGTIAPPASALAAYRALLPLRFFLGGMFLYAGIDKLIDPGFLRASGAGSIGSQLEVFVRVSPLAPLVSAFAVPYPVAMGLLISVAEIAIGLGVLTGILYRVSAAAGAFISLLFLLTASWSTRPIYYGPDLPYMVGWATLALAGHGGLYVFEPQLLERLRRLGLPALLRDDGTPATTGRRTFLLAGVLGAVTLVVAGGARVLGRAFVGESPATASTKPGASAAPASPGTTAQPAASGAPASPGAPASGPVIANDATMKPRSAITFQLTNGDPGVLVKLADGTVVAYDAVCTHEGCEVGYDRPSGLLFCPCHGATFDPAHDAAVLAGPAPTPLASVPIVVDGSTGAITLAG